MYTLITSPAVKSGKREENLLPREKGGSNRHRYGAPAKAIISEINFRVKQKSAGCYALRFLFIHKKF